MTTTAIDQANSEFWNELCGSHLARQLGINDHSLDSLRRYDDAYLSFYPYLLERVPVTTFAGKRVVEVGLGYGTLGHRIAEHAAEYIGLDIAEGPVRMMNHRMQMMRFPGRAMCASILDCPLPDESVDAVVAIGCYHHTGNVQRAIDETHRILRKGGTAYLMVYNHFSARQWVLWPRATARAFLAELLGRTPPADVLESQRAAYDSNADGSGAPETVFCSARSLRRMLQRFDQVELEKENFDDFIWRGRVIVGRPAMLGNLAKVLGLDIYIQAVK